MEIISLRGPQNSGKITTLTIVHDKLLEQSSQNPNNHSEGISNDDSLDVIEHNGRKAGIITQGDYSRRECSTKSRLKELKDSGYDVAIYACTIGYDKDSTQTAINAYPTHDYIEKKWVDDATLYNTANHEDANKIMALPNLQKTLFVLLNKYIDWEGAFLSTALHVGVIPGSEIKYRVHTAAPTLDAVCSVGGFETLPNYSSENMPKDYTALVLIGGSQWDSPEAELVEPLVQEVLNNGKPAGAICNGAPFLCVHGFLNNVKHTGNGPDQPKQWSGERYTNETRYVNVQVVSDKNITTANITGYLEFTRGMSSPPKANTPKKIVDWYDFYKNGSAKQ